MIARVLLTAFLLVGNSVVASEPEIATISGFSSMCAMPPTAESAARFNSCASYIGGLVDGIRATSAIIAIVSKRDLNKPLEDIGLCLPDWDLTNGQWISILAGYVERNDVAETADTRTTFILSLIENYPCGGH